MQDIFIYAGLLIIGVIVGLIIAKFAFASDTQDKNQQQKDQATAMAHAQLREQLSVAGQTLKDVEAQIAMFKEQLTEVDYILTSHEQGEDQPRITFFGDHASPYIKESNKEAKQQSTSEHQPKDFSNSSSGLFIGEQADKAK